MKDTQHTRRVCCEKCETHTICADPPPTGAVCSSFASPLPRRGEERRGAASCASIRSSAYCPTSPHSSPVHTWHHEARALGGMCFHTARHRVGHRDSPSLPSFVSFPRLTIFRARMTTEFSPPTPSTLSPLHHHGKYSLRTNAHLSVIHTQRHCPHLSALNYLQVPKKYMSLLQCSRYRAYWPCGFVQHDDIFLRLRSPIFLIKRGHSSNFFSKHQLFKKS